MRNFAKILLFVLMFAGLFCYLASSFAQRGNGTDFLHFYTAAQMVKEGYGHQLYDPATQREFQARFTGRVGTYFNHPAFEALLYLPFALLPLPKAYIVWNAANAVLLLWFAKLLRWVVPDPDWLFLAVLSLLFVPVLLNFLQGQDAVLLLFLITTALAALYQRREKLAGCLCALGLFKFHLVLAIVAIILVTRPRKFFAGFFVAALALLLVCVAVSGWNFIVDYPQFLLAQNGVPLSGIHPLEMGNLRGLAELFGITGSAQLPTVAIVSLLVFGLAVGGPRTQAVSGPALNFHYAKAVFAAVLVSYHLSPHDLSILLLPMAVFARPLLRAPSSWAINFLRLTWLVFFLPPLHLWLLSRYAYVYTVVPILILFLATCDEKMLLVLSCGNEQRP